MDFQEQESVLDVWKEWVRLREGGGFGSIQGFVEERIKDPALCQTAVNAIRKWEKVFQRQTRR